MAVRSPCINVCTIDKRSGHCLGCGRTIDEIMRWPLASEPERAALVAVLPKRLAARRRRWWQR